METHFHKQTPLEAQKILEDARHSGTRLRLFFGNFDTGLDWMEEHDVIGTVGRSTGSQKVPLLIHNARSMGGGQILDHCIVKIMTNKGRTLYKHDKYYMPQLSISSKPEHLAEGLGWAVLKGDEVHARFKQERQASNYCEFLTGARMSK